MTFCSCNISQRNILSRIVSENPLEIQQCSLGWKVSMGYKLQGVKYRSDLIKSKANIFNTCPLVAFLSIYSDLDLGFLMWSLLAIEFIKSTLSCDRLFLIDINDPHIYFSLCLKLMTGWWIWYCINDIRDSKIFTNQ